MQILRSISYKIDQDLFLTDKQVKPADELGWFYDWSNRQIKFGSRLLFFLLCVLFAIPALSSTNAVADKVFVNAKVYTANPKQPFAQAIAIKAEKIIFVGSNDVADSFVGADTKVVNLQGARVLPGFIDNHNHIFEAASEAGGNCELSPLASPPEQIPLLQDCLENSKPDQWIIGWGHSIDITLDEQLEFSPLEIIDSVITDRPVIIMEQTSHSMWVNSVALELAGITADTPDPQGGKIMRDTESGELSGILIDSAGDIVMAQAWNSLEDKFSQSYDGLLNGLDEIAKHGITSVGDGRLYWKRGWYEVWKAVQANGELTARVSLRPWIYPHLKQSAQLKFLSQIYTADNQQLLIVNQVKMYSDGIIINGTAKTVEPYDFTYFPESPYGINYIPPSEMESWLKSLSNIGFGAHIHAIGDGAVRESLDAIEASRKSGSKQIYNMTHVEMVNANDIQRFALLKVDVDFQLGSDYLGAADHDWAISFIGSTRAHNLIPIRQIYDSGANVTLSSDWNVNPLSPLAGIANAVKLKDKGLPNIIAAIDAYTINAAKALGIESITGSLEVGKSADLVILDDDIFDQPPQVIKNAKVIQTLLQGKTVFGD